MPSTNLSDQEFIAEFTQYGAAEMSRRTGASVRAIYKRRRAIEDRIDRPIHAPSNVPTENHPERQLLTVDNGVVLVGSDAHYWPGEYTTAHRAFVRACHTLKPKAVIMNGDVFDGASISRHAPIGWEDRPSVEQEIEVCTDQLDEILEASKGAAHIWTLGNHDARFESKLATVASEYAGVNGMHLKDNFPDWIPCWSCLINDDVMVKHRYKGGIHATHNNTMWAGKTMVTGHLHSLKVTPFTDYNGTRWGVDTGTMANTYGPQFRDYMEDNPRNWRTGFAVLTFHEGRLLWPEVMHVIADGQVEFRGKVYDV
jgi:hypothetical protein